MCHFNLSCCDNVTLGRKGPSMTAASSSVSDSWLVAPGRFNEPNA